MQCGLIEVSKKGVRHLPCLGRLNSGTAAAEECTGCTCRSHMLSWCGCRLVLQVSFMAEQLLASVSSAPQGIAESAAGLSANTQPAVVRAPQGHRVHFVFTLRPAGPRKLACSGCVTRVMPACLPVAAAQGADSVTAIDSEAQSQASSSRRHSRATSGDGSEAGFSDGGHSYVSRDGSRSGEHTYQQPSGPAQRCGATGGSWVWAAGAPAQQLVEQQAT